MNQEKEFTKTETRNTAVSQALPFAPHTASSSKVLEALSTDAEKGLSESDAAKRIETYGPNRLKPPKRPSVWKIIGRQFANAMSIVLSEFASWLLDRGRRGRESRLGRDHSGKMAESRADGTVAAMAVSLGTFDYISGGVIAALVLMNVSVGSYTEWEAEKVSHLLLLLFMSCNRRH